jgi:phage gp29-like protein
MGWLTPRPNKLDNFAGGARKEKKITRTRVTIPQARKMGMKVPDDWKDDDKVTIETTVDEKGHVHARIV